MPPSTVYSSGHIVAVLRRSPVQITSPSPSPCHRADKTLPQPQLDQQYEGRHQAERVQIAEVSCVWYLIGWIAKTFDYINRVTIRFAFGLRGYVDRLSSLVAMLLLDRSCVIVGIFLKYYVPQHFTQHGWQHNLQIGAPPPSGEA